MNGTTNAEVATTGPTPKRLDIYVIDTGWNVEMRRVLKVHLELFQTYFHHRDSFYVLDEQQSTEILKANPRLIGRDPVLVVLDTDAMVEKRRGGHGFRCCLGRLKSPLEADEVLKDLLQIVLDKEKSRNINAAVREEIHKAGLNGAIEIIGQSVGGLHG